ncbi:MAG: MarR family transcriptional regulator [Paracoccaceae bacterium]|nr:MarR family transcriptional regulator [Paracoccaceae bacterium]
MELYTMAGHLIRRLHQRSTQVFQARAQEAGIDLTQVQFAAMEVLCDHEGIDQARIAALIAYDRATIGGVIDRLEKKGYLRRVVSRQDRRAREVSLTPEGRAILDRLRPTVVALQDEILADLTPPERAALLALMGKALHIPDPARPAAEGREGSA